MTVDHTGKSERNADLDTLARCAHQVKNGFTHGPADVTYSICAVLLSVFCTVFVTIWWFYLPTSGLWDYLGFALLALPFLIYWTVMRLTEPRRISLPSWAAVIDDLLQSYIPLDADASGELQQEIEVHGGVSPERLLQWIKTERQSVKALPDAPPEVARHPREFIRLPRASGKH